MKKVLSIVLSLAMVVCMMPLSVFAASAKDAAYSDIAGEKCEGAVNVLSALGVVDGYEDGSYKPANIVTRAEMAKLIITALGMESYATATTSSYTDMTNAKWAVPVVEYATNLGIINGYGNGKFGPNDTVTYEQAATMIVRALGYTTDCNEMNGTWPAIYIQKATALGLFKDVSGNQYGTGANRGDVAIMLYNALEIPEVYADKDGETHNKNGEAYTDENGAKHYANVTMMSTLNKDGESYYTTITSQMADDAITDIREYIGAAAKVTVDKNDNVLAVGDIKTVFLTGDISSDGKNFKVGDTNYTLTGASLVDINKATGGKATGNANVGADRIENGETADPSDATLTDGAKGITLGAKVSGKTIKEIYSIATWTVDKDDMVGDSDLDQITKNSKLLGKKFAKDDDNEIDTASFILNGVDSLKDIKEDNVVYVYVNSKDEITRVDVGTRVVTGVINKVNSAGDQITIDGTVYKTVDASKRSNADLSNVASDNAGDTVKVYLDFAGKIYSSELEDGTSGNYAVIVDIDSNKAPSGSAIASASKVQLLTPDGVKVYNVNGKKYIDNQSTTWTDLAEGDLVKFSVNDAGEITKIIEYTEDSDDYPLETTTAATITKAGYLNGKQINDNAAIFTAPYNNSWDFSDTDDLAVTNKANIVGSDINASKYLVDAKTNKIVALLMDDSSTSGDTYGIATAVYNIADNNKSANFYIGTTEVKDGEIDGTAPAVASKTVVSTALYKIKKTTSGSYTFASFDSIATEEKPVTISNGYVTLTTGASANQAGIKTGATKVSLYSGLVVYVYDQSDDEFSIGDKSDLTDDDVTKIAFYATSDDSKDDNYGLIDYAVIYRK